MKQPKVIRITCKVDPILIDIPDEPINCILQDREDGDDSKIVYIANPYFKKGTKDTKTGAPFIALTKTDYEVV